MENLIHVIMMREPCPGNKETVVAGMPKRKEIANVAWRMSKFTVG